MTWWKDSVVYQIYPRSFMDSNGDGIGDLQGIIQKLDYLKKLGIDIIWLSPVYDSPNDDNGYDIRDYFKIMSEFGTMQDFDQMLDEIHKRDMKLMMDLVVNHTSDEHEWFAQYPDFYYWQDQPNNWKSVFGGPAWEFDDKRNQYYLHIFSKKQPDLNWENPNLREKVYDMMRWWLDKGVDGFRMDVINFISKDSELPDTPDGDGSPYFMNGPRIHEFLHEMNQEVLSNYDCVTVGEMPGAAPGDAQKYTNPDNQELNMIFTFEHMDLDGGSDKWDLKPLNLVDLKENLEKWQHALFNVGWNSLYWNNHDQPRIVSRFGDDQEYRVESAKMLATCLHMMQGTPYIYQGEEVGMTNVAFESIDQYEDIETLNMYQEKKEQGWSHEDIMRSIHVKGRDNARTPMQWNDAANAGFTTGEPWLQVNPNYKAINVKQALEETDSIFYYYQSLISLRKTYDVITNGDFTLIHRDHPDIFAYKRETDQETLTVYCNFSANEYDINQPSGEILIQNYESSHEKLRPWEAVVFYEKKGES
ncbi:oligo-1,6-glucosidase [Aquisalibacillus elongatus]|uniref:oligo-1,6-glucosidase n=2 Tax=Aquisalibacillus elongatus TaxID=485577 RepID=A0A3N5BYX8_9BACI|nr:alpha-glucosidase [Aquisalibacillus elongatus]RPF51055.1 oligo-1,6-glucosidase [Aquisalibacillus elongatus]